MQESKSALHALATVLRASPESDALVILGRLLDSLPIGFHVTDCEGQFRVVYANRAWHRWLQPAGPSVTGKPLGEIFPSAEQAGVLEIMREVCATGRPKHLKGFEFQELGASHRRNVDETSHWDWEIYPLKGPSPKVTFLLNVIMEVSKSPRPGRQTTARPNRQAENRRREEASGVLRIFGLAPESADEDLRAKLTEREYQIAELMAMGLTNFAIGKRLNVSMATVSSHVAHILSKLNYRSRAQVAAWVVAGHFRRRVADSSKETSGEA